MLVRKLVLALSAASVATAANAGDFTYTLTRGPACADIKHSQPIAAWRCHGPAGYGASFFDEGNTVSVAFGPFGREEPLINNDLMWRGADKVFGDKLEWRMEDGKPYAAILRVWRIDADAYGEPAVQGLLVAKVTPSGSCKIGVVNAERPDANAAARKLADTAPAFRCGVDRPQS